MSPLPRDGQESLPPYTCTVHVEGFLPRKMELDAPGQLAAYRKWHRYYVVLHGTILHVYLVDISRLYNGDVSAAKVWQLSDGPFVHTEPQNQAEGSVEADAVPSDVAWEQLRTALDKERKHSYSMEGAECGLAADYTKRNHVIRLKVGGEQFLLQLRNTYHVIDWIEALQASSNVATDLDRRVMPSFVTLPRSRRRRMSGHEAMVLGLGHREAASSGGAGLSNYLAAPAMMPAQ